MSSKDKKRTLAIEEAKYLRFYINQLNEENAALAQEIERQDECSKEAKRTLNDYIGNITSHEELVSKMSTTISNLEVLIKSQEETIKEIQAELLKLSALNSFSDRNDNEPCAVCKSTSPKNSRGFFATKYDALLKEIEQDKEDLNVLVKELENLEEQENSSSHEPIQQIFNAQNYKVLQKILEEAEDSDEVLLFADQNHCTWQIINRKDLNSKGELTEQDVLAMEEIEDKNNRVIRGKHPVIDIDKIESEYTGNEKEERVVVIEDLDNGGTEEKKEDN
eukprot:TRINITY_DN3227_c0_g1_i10.p1 TRINITY_DN3227_c0_g1~~TRINITY_DN3227_c0_g1_i10.p1  ORF type:complete len:278 (-),score=113.18 TRINITY_DN3227_c0_g1_i10:139-972(-)